MKQEWKEDIDGRKTFIGKGNYPNEIRRNEMPNPMEKYFDLDMSDPPIQGEVVMKNRMIEAELTVNHPIYLSSHGYICGECNNLMIEDGFPRNGKVRAFCDSLHCSQNLVTKEIECPVTTNYKVIPVDAA